MTTPTILMASATTLVFMVLAWVLPGLLGLEGTQLWILRGALGFLALVAGLLFHRVLAIRARRRGPRRKDPEEERLDLLFREARNRLASARGTTGTSRLGRLPAILVLGPPGSTKTTTIVQSGMEPELLAGEVHRGDAVVPTEAVNLWYADGVVVVEAGGAAAADPGRWSRLVARLRPARLKAALLRKPQAPRAAVVCVGVDEFLKPDASRSVPELARGLRGRLGEAARELGIQLPVYVLLTRTDRLPYFEDFARNLTDEEAAELLGATLPLRSFHSSGAYGDEQTRRLRGALDELHRSLALKRLELLPRENSEEVRQAAYEFPREIRKLAGPVQEFLLELCRPGHLGANPILRGFYFTGVRAVLVSDRGPATVEPEETVRDDPATAGATQVFSAARIQQEGAPAGGAPGAGTTRKVPQWVFLRRIFQGVILQDGSAMGMTGSGTQVNLLRRLALGGVAAAAVVAIMGMTVSFFSNRNLQHDVVAGLRSVEAPPALVSMGEDEEDGGAVADAQLHHLRQLDRLGEELDRLREWDDGRPPLRYRWGLYRGSALLPEARAAYFRRFGEILWEDTRTRLASHLGSLPEEPDAGSSYEETYNALKAYLIATDHPEESSPGFLTPVLMTHWRGDAEADDELGELARRQFDRFAAELPHGNPYADPASQTLVADTRSFLERFAALDQFYQALVSGVSSELGVFQFADVHPTAGSVLRSEFSVPGAFTREGWSVVQEVLADPEALLVSEEWVVGERAVSPEDRVALAEALETRYVQDYIRHWQEFLRTGSVRTFAAVADAANALHTLSGRDSPIVHLLSQVSRKTSVASERVRSAFQPVHEVVPPEEDEAAENGAGGGDRMGDYLDHLLNLQTSLDQLTGASGPRLEQVLLQAERDASQGRGAVGQLARDFHRDGEARQVGDDVERLLDEPLSLTARLLSGYEQAQAAQGINAQGADFCSRFDEVVRLYPFETASGAEADVDDVKALFQPGASRLSSFHDEVMDDLVARQGGRYETRSGASPAPSAAFLNFYNQAHRIAEGLFDEQGEGPRVRFFLRVEASERVPEIEVQVDGQSQVYTRTAAPTRDFVWDGEQARSVRIVGVVDGERRTLVEGEGPWGVFRLFQAASRWQSLGGGIHEVAWSVPGLGVELTAEVSFTGAGHPVFRSDFLAGARCVPAVVG